MAGTASAINENDPFHDPPWSDPNLDPQAETDVLGTPRKKIKTANFIRSAKAESVKAESATLHNRESTEQEEAVRENVSDKFKNSPMLDGKFFKVDKYDGHDGKSHIEAICQACLPTKKIIKGSLEITTNFVKHLKRVHRDTYVEYGKYKEEKQKKRSRCRSKESETQKPSKQLNQKTLLNHMDSTRMLGGVTQKAFERRIINFIINSKSGISVIDDPSFVQLFDGMHVKVVGRTAAMELITDMYHMHVANLRKDVQGQYVCLTADVWSAARRSFLGVAVHWIDDDLNRKSAALACKRCSGVHDYEHLADMLEKINLQYGLGTSQIVATVTGNGGGFVKAFREFATSADDDAEADGRDDGDVQLQEIEPNDGNDEDEINFEEIGRTESKLSLSKHVRCCSHTLSLIATTNCKEAVRHNVAIKTRHDGVFFKCQTLWTEAGRPESGDIIKEVLGHSLCCPGQTRWNAYFDAVSKLLNDKAKLPLLFHRLNLPYFKENELLYLEEYCVVLKPLATTLDILQGEECVYYGYILPSLLSLRNKWDKLQQQQFSSGGALLLQTGLESLKYRFSDILNMSCEDAIISAVIHPKFKLRWYNVVKHPNVTIDLIRKMVVSAAEKLMADNSDALSSSSDTDGFFDFAEFGDTDRSMSGSNAESKVDKHVMRNTANIELELYKFLDDKRSDLNMLGDYPMIRKLFIRYNTCLPSSVPVERLFPYASIVNCPRRHALSDDNFEQLVILKANNVNL